MVQEIQIDKSLSKDKKYETLLSQIKSLVEGESDPIANVANIMAVLKFELDFFWVGCYFVSGEELILGPFQGPLACTRIKKGKGVCGVSWATESIINVPDVEQFEGHIACSSQTKSEIVLPIKNSDSRIIGVLDVDSDELNSFDSDDKNYLGKIADLIGEFYER